MCSLHKIKLNNGINLITKINKKTPRIAFTLYFKINEQEKYSGLYSLLNRLFFKGAKNILQLSWQTSLKRTLLSAIQI